MFETLILTVLKCALCQFFGYCTEHDDCPDGVCDDALRAIDSLGEATPPVLMAPEAPAPLTAIKWDWSYIEPLTNAVVELVRCIKGLIGMSPQRVG